MGVIRFMTIQWERDRRMPASIAAAIFVCAVATGIWRGLGALPILLNAVFLGGLCFGAFALRIAIRSLWALLLMELLAAGASVPVLEGWFAGYVGMQWWGLAAGLLLALTIQLLIYALTGSVKICAIGWLSFCFAFGLLDAAVYQFNGNLVNLADIYSITAAMNVAGNHYSIRPTPNMAFTLLFFICVVAGIARVRVDRKRCASLKWRCAGMAAMAMAAIWPTWVALECPPHMRSLTSVAHESMLMSLFCQANAMRVARPENYSGETLARLAAENPPAEGAEGEKPHVIAIMVESLSDLTVLGDFRTDPEVFPFLNEFRRQSVHGTALSSTFGGGTARSEWEFLTGNSLGLMPPSCMPYVHYVKEGTRSLVRVFENLGYHTVGMHPYPGNGWNRNEAYPHLGFDDIYFLEDLEWDGEVRGLVSDSAFVHQVIRLYERRDRGAPMFCFGVTMQDHGSYAYPDFRADVHITDMEGRYPEAEQYLSLMRLTDAAMRELIEYFSGCDEKVCILFFGDHQPRLSDAFYRALGAKDDWKRFEVPFFIWNNYGLGAEEIRMTSLNFLGPKLLEVAGLPMPTWYTFLNARGKEICAMNRDCYFWHGEPLEYNGDWPDALRDIDVMQYANLFDEDADGALFVGLPRT